MPRRTKMSEIERAAKRKLDGREAARRCRAKKINRIKTLEEKVKKLEKLLEIRCARCQRLGGSFAKSPEPSEPEFSMNLDFYNAQQELLSSPYTYEEDLESMQSSLPTSPNYWRPEMHETLNALSFPKDVDQNDKVIFSKHPMVLRKSQRAALTSLDELHVGRFQLRDIVKKNTGITPSLRQSWEIVVPPKH